MGSEMCIRDSNYGRDDAELRQGDVDLNGEVNFLDFLILAENFGRHREQG